MAIKKAPARRGHPPPKRRARPITEAEMVFCHLCISGDGGKGMSYEDAAVKLGFDSKEGAVIAQRKAVRDYFPEYQRMFMLEMARTEATQVQKFDVTRAAAVALLWKLANTAPERTRGTITGQVEAIGEIKTVLGWEIKPRDFEDLLGSLTEDEQLYVALHGKMPAKGAVQ